tara:strand:+ start:1122 stop:1688 length:567 start_codon:yes stop_codon:yes gene_type:complete
MSDLILFISPNLLKKETNLGGSVDDNNLAPAIRMAQDRYILPALGEKLFETLQGGISGATLNGNEETLLRSYIQPALVFLAYAEALPLIRVRVVNNSVTVMDSEQSTSASYADLKPLMNRALELGQFHLERLIDYLDNNPTLYPTLDTESSGEYKRNRRNYTQGLNVDYNPGDRIREAKLRALIGPVY